MAMFNSFLYVYQRVTNQNSDFMDLFFMGFNQPKWWFKVIFKGFIQPTRIVI